MHNFFSLHDCIRERVLRFDFLGNIGDIGIIHWDLLLSVALVWILTAACLIRGVRSCGKVSLVTGFLPFSILLAFMVYSVQKDGAEMVRTLGSNFKT